MALRWRLSRPTLRGLRWWVLTAISVVLVSVWFNAAYYTIKKERSEWYFAPVTVQMFAPKFLSAGDDEQIRFSFKNLDAKAVNVAFRLINHSPVRSFPRLVGNNDVYFGSIQSQEQVYRQVDLFVAASAWQVYGMRHGDAGYNISEALMSSTPGSVPISVRIAPMARARWISYNLGIALVGLALWFSKEMWDQIGKQAR